MHACENENYSNEEVAELLPMVTLEVTTFRSCVQRCLVIGAHGTSQRELKHSSLTWTLSVSQRYRQECMVASEGSFPYNRGSATGEQTNQMWCGAWEMVQQVMHLFCKYESLRTHIKSGCSHMVSCLHSGAVIDHALEQFGEKGAYFTLYFQVTAHRCKKSRQKLKEPGGGNWSPGHGGILLLGVFLLDFPVCFIIHPRTTCPWVALPSVGWDLLHQTAIKKMLP